MLCRASLQFERTVGQLDCNDFLRAQQLFDGTATVSNESLRPSSTNGIMLNFDLRPGFGGALSLRLTHNWLREVVDLIPIGDGQQGIGNIDQAKEWLVEFDLTVPLAKVWRGTELAVNGNWRRTRVVDPFNGESRLLQGTWASIRSMIARSSGRPALAARSFMMVEKLARHPCGT